MSVSQWITRSLIAIASLTGVILAVLGIWLFQLDREVKTRLETATFVPPTKYFSAPYSIEAGQTVNPKRLVARLKQSGYRERSPKQRLLEEDYALLNADTCRSTLPADFPESLSHCVLFYTSAEFLDELQMIAIADGERVLQTFRGNPLRASDKVELPPELFAQFLEGQPIFQLSLELGEVPTHCLNAVLAIEDARFLDHAGISPTGIIRAFFVNLKEGRAAQGGSTITQQLVKNMFLTHQKTLRRKVTEVGMSLMLEARANKDQILTSYLNIIYLGQGGPYQVRGYKAASRHYLNKDINRLNLAECALMAAVINNPGRYSPLRNPENAKARRSLVLARMAELDLISEDEKKAAEEFPLPDSQSQYTSVHTAAYFVDAVNQELERAGIEVKPGLSIYTSMHADAQAAAEKSMNLLDGLDERVIKKKADRKGKKLQGALISVSPEDGKIRALAGGRDFRTSPYNRATEAERQLGSVMKPIVYLAALESYNEDGEFYSPLTILKDETFTHRYEGQSWSPENYGRDYYGDVPMYFALKNSLNASTARLGLDLGLDPVVDMARRLGVESPLESLPSITLGAFELKPMEVARAYTAIARFGNLIDLTTVSHVVDLNGEIIYEPEQEAKQVVAPTNVALLIGMLKNTFVSGTAQSASAWGFRHPAAGKTGTTSDYRDAWFAGFTPKWVTVSWVGYDDNTSHGLTGGSGALPLWLQYMTEMSRSFTPKDFAWPEDVEAQVFEFDDLGITNQKLEERENEFPVELILRK